MNDQLSHCTALTPTCKLLLAVRGCYTARSNTHQHQLHSHCTSSTDHTIVLSYQHTINQQRTTVRTDDCSSQLAPLPRSLTPALRRCTTSHTQHRVCTLLLHSALPPSHSQPPPLLALSAGPLLPLCTTTPYSTASVHRQYVWRSARSIATPLCRPRLQRVCHSRRVWSQVQLSPSTRRLSSTHAPPRSLPAPSSLTPSLLTSGSVSSSAAPLSSSAVSNPLLSCKSVRKLKSGLSTVLSVVRRSSVARCGHSNGGAQSNQINRRGLADGTSNTLQHDIDYSSSQATTRSRTDSPRLVN